MAQLCETCRRIDLHALFHHRIEIIPSRRRNIDIAVGTLSQVKLRSTNCHFCELLTSPRAIWPRRGDENDDASKDNWILHLSNAGSRFLAYPLDNLDWNLAPVPITQNVYAYLCPPNDSESLIQKAALAPVDIEYLHRLEEDRHSFLHVISPSHLTEGRQMTDFLQPSIQVLKDWISRCEKKHAGCKIGTGHPHKTWSRFRTRKTSSPPKTSQSERFKKYFKLVDVQSRRITTSAPASRYCTLSYVCGAPETNVPLDWQRGPSARYPYLPNRLPKTIEDAVKLTAMLGERYLWVDSLCIIHNDQTELFTQLQEMANIYNNAVCCIAFVSGANADSGIPGVSLSRKVEELQRCTNVNDTIIGMSLPPLHHILDKSTYQKRAWIFQESLLSRRTIYITDREAFFSCTTTFERESIWESHKSHSSPAYFGLINPSKNFQSDVAKYNGKPGFYSFSDYARHVEEYTTRSLTRAEDIMYAFTGTAKLISGQLQMAIHYGIPLGASPLGAESSIVMITLAWEYQAAHSATRCGPVEFDIVHTRRIPLPLVDGTSNSAGTPAFPSWSWYAWTGPKRYHIHHMDEIKAQMMSLADEETVLHMKHLTHSTDSLFPDPKFLTDPLTIDEDIVITPQEDSQDIVQQVLARLSFYDTVKTHQKGLPNGVLLLMAKIAQVKLARDWVKTADVGFPPVSLMNVDDVDEIGAASIHCGGLAEVPEERGVYFASLLEYAWDKHADPSFSVMSWRRSDERWANDETVVLGLVLGGGPPTLDATCKPLYRLGIGAIPISEWKKLDAVYTFFYLI